MLVDDVTIDVKAGDGGDGAVAFNRNKMELGPVGGSGGSGGSVRCVGTADIGALSRWRNTKDAHAGNGSPGHGQYRDGTDGADVSFPVPVGTVIHNLNTGTDTEVEAIGQEVVLAKGGRGGRGNFHFRSSVDTSPKRFEPGTPGERFRVRLELKLIADVGLIGLPNAGKSSLINELTRAKQKVANYPFTTLEPALGVYYGLILADIPGLIEGAAEGKGLGHKFLRHVERTRTLLHLVAADAEDPVRDWKLVRGELTAYGATLAAKPERVLLSKSDAVAPEVLHRHLAAFRAAGMDADAVSIHDSESLARLEAFLRTLIAAKQAQ